MPTVSVGFVWNGDAFFCTANRHFSRFLSCQRKKFIFFRSYFASIFDSEKYFMQIALQKYVSMLKYIHNSNEWSRMSHQLNFIDFFFLLRFISLLPLHSLHAIHSVHFRRLPTWYECLCAQAVNERRTNERTNIFHDGVRSSHIYSTMGGGTYILYTV